MKNGQLKSGYNLQIGVEGEYKSKCTKAKGNKLLYVSKNFVRLRKDSLKNISTKEGILLRVNRSIQLEVLLMAFAYTMNKFHSKTMQKRNGKLLHETDIA